VKGHQSNELDESGILVVNAGSSSIKFALYRTRGRERLKLGHRGEIEGSGDKPRLLVMDPSGELFLEQRLETQEPVTVRHLVKTLMGWIESHFGARHLRAAGHRVALGGLEHSAPILLTDSIVETLRALTPLAPLHQPHNLEPVEALWALCPKLPQVACFDTAFHRTMPRVAELYGLPRRITEAGARRYGFHGLSYEYIAADLARIDPEEAAGRAVVAHLGSGASLCALLNGRSVATTMGFSPLSGLVMGTRPGELDPGLVLWLMCEKHFSPSDIEAMLYHESGLLGVSGISSDMRELLVSTNPHAREAIDLFVYRICREIGSLAAALSGLDVLVFTGGIGENSALIRAAVCRQCAWLGVAVDETANQRGAPIISTLSSNVKVRVIATDEELMIARHVAAIVVSNNA
jgi:acetate kinase